jgi:hypothetical protein
MTTISTTTSTLSRQQVPDDRRVNLAHEIFGIHFPMQLEPAIYTFASNLSEDYTGGYWQFYSLSNNGFYMAPDDDHLYRVACENGFEGRLSADALGITACLYAYSHLSFGGGAFADTCGQQYHWLREYMFEHAEARDILRAID